MPQTSNSRMLIQYSFINGLSLCLIYFLFLGSNPLMSPDEGRYVEIPREMLATGNFITPHLNGIIYFEKPVLFYWIQAAGLKLLGDSLFAMRVPNALIAVLGCIFSYIAGHCLFNRRAGILAAFICASSCLYFALGHFIATDMSVAVFMSASFFCFALALQNSARRWIYGTYVFSALAVMTKGLIGVLLPGFIVLLWFFLSGQWQLLKRFRLVSGTFLFLLIVLPWHILVQIKNPEFFHYYVIEQQFMRYLTDYAERSQPIWFLPLVFLLGSLPWTIFLANLIVDYCKNFSGRLFFRRRAGLQLSQQQQVRLLLSLAVISIFLFFWLSHSQLMAYILPLFPLLSLMLGEYLDRAIAAKKRFQWHFLALAISISTASFILLLKPPPAVMPGGPFYLKLSLVLFTAVAWLCFLLSVKTHLIKAIAGLISGFLLALACLFLTYSKYNTSSNLVLARAILPLVKQDTRVIIYHTYLQDVPVYLKRKLTLVDWEGELTFGIPYTPGARQWMINDRQLWQNWQTAETQYMFMFKKDYERLKADKPLYLVREFRDMVVVSNKKDRL